MQIDPEVGAGFLIPVKSSAKYSVHCKCIDSGKITVFRVFVLLKSAQTARKLRASRVLPLRFLLILGDLCGSRIFGSRYTVYTFRNDGVWRFNSTPHYIMFY